MKKNIVVGGFDEKQREKNLLKIKDNYSKKGYKFLSYKDNGTLKSIASFEVEQSILKKEKSKNIFILSGIFFLLSVYLFIKGS